MKWFLMQSFFLALAAFGLGALFHRLLWKRTTGVSSSLTDPVNRFASSGGAEQQKVDGDTAAARTAEVASLRAEHATVLAERDAKIKEYAALFFEHSAAKTALADRDASIASLRAELDVATTSSSAALAETQGLLGQVESHNATIEDLHHQLAAANADHDAALSTLRIDYDARLAALGSEHDGALAELRSDYEGRLGTCAADHDAAIAALRAEHDRALQEVHGDRDRTLSGLRSDHERVLAELRRRAESAEDELVRVEAQYEACTAEMSRLRSELDAKPGEVQGLVSDLEATKLRVADDLESIEGIVPAMSEASNVEGLAVATDEGSDEAFEGDEVSADDLLRIEGIGPKISEILMAGGIRTFRRLAAMPADRVRSIVNAGGVSFIPSVGTWAAQAALLRDGDEDGFVALVDRLVTGRDDPR